MKKMVTLILTAILMVLSYTTVSAQDWRVVREHDRMTMTDRSYIITTAVMASPGYEHTRGSLRFVCLLDELHILYRFDSFMVGDRDSDVTLLIGFGDKAPVEQWGALNTEQRGAFVRMGRVNWFVNEAKAASRAQLCAEDPYDGEVICHGFSMMGVTAALNSLSCYR